MTDDLSKYFPLVSGIQADLDADAVLVIVIGGRMGNGGCPALRFCALPDGLEFNRNLVATLCVALEIIHDGLPEDTADWTEDGRGTS